MSISRRALYEAGEPFGDSCTVKKVGGGRIYGGGGGGGGGTSTQVVDLPEWVKPYAKDVLAKTAEETGKEYKPYEGQRVADFSGLQQQAQTAAGAMQIAPQIGQATGIAGQAAQQALGAASQYRAASAGDISSLRGAGAQLAQQLQPGIQYGMGAGERLEGKIDPALQASLRAGERLEGIIAPGVQAAMGAGQRLEGRIDPALQAALGAGTAYGQMATDPRAMQAYMSPYMQNVVDIEKREAQRQADIAATGRGAQAVRAGAFGGSRQAILEAEAQRNLQQQLGDIQSRGLQSAFERAQQAQQFGADVGLRGIGQGLQAQQAAAQLGLSGIGQGLQAQQAAAQLGLSGLGQGLQAQQAAAQLGLSGVGQSMQAQQAAADLGLRGTQAALSGTQFGSELGLRGAQAATQAAQTLGGLGATQFGQQKDIIGLQSQLGAEQRAREQALADVAYQDYLTKQQYPYQQLGFMADMIRGVPVGQTATTIGASPSIASQLIGAGTTAYGLSRMKEGGSVKSYVEGGGISGLNPIEREAALDNMGDRQMQGLMGLADVSDLAKLQVAEKLQQNAQLRKAAAMAQAAQQPQPQTTVAEEALMDMGLGALDVPDDVVSAAEGGIIGFQAGGAATDNVYVQNELARLRALLGMAGSDAERAEVQAQIARLDPTATAVAPAQLTAAPATGIAGLPGMQKQFMGMMISPEVTAAQKRYREQMEAVSADELAAAKEETALIKAQQAELGERGAEREKYLKGQQEGLKGKEDKEFNMALIEAGLAMMAGTSANPFENIGKGALAGTKAYRVGMGKIADRRDKLNDALFNLYDLRYGDKMANQKELRAAEAKVRSAKTGMKKTAAQVTKELNIDIPQAALTKSLELASDQLAAQIKAGATRAARDPVDVQMEKYFALKAEGKDAEAAALMKNIETAQRGKYAGYQPAAVRADVAVETAIQRDPAVVAAAEALSLATSSNDPVAMEKAMTALREAEKKARAKFGLPTNAPTGGGASNQQVLDYSSIVNVAP